MTTGTLTIGGRPASGEQVVLYAPGEPPLLDVATSGDGGRFTFDVAELPAGARVLAKARREVVGLAWTEPDGGSLEIDVPGPFHAVRIALSGADAPEGLTLWLDPEALPRDAARLARVAGPRVREAHYVRRRMSAAGCELRLAAGAWRIGAEALLPDRVPGDGPNPNRAAVRATAHGRALDGSWEDGFLLQVADPVELTLELAAV